MSAESASMKNFSAKVLRVVAETPGLTLSGLVEKMNRVRIEHAEKTGEKLKKVSRTHLWNVLHGSHDCSMLLADEVATALDIPLTDLISSEKNIQQLA